MFREGGRNWNSLAGEWPGERLVSIWNSLPGVVAVKKFQSRNTAIGRIWARIQGLVLGADNSGGGGDMAPNPRMNGENAKGHERKGKRAARRSSVTTWAALLPPRGSIFRAFQETMSWQRHTVRGFLAGAMKKAGYAIESFKPASGERSYRITH